MSTPTRTRKLRSRHATSSMTVPAEPDDVSGNAALPSAPPHASPIARCVREEMARYFETLDGQAPHDLHRLVMQQAERALLGSVMEQTRHNQSKAATWLGISRGTLRVKLAEMERES